MFGSVTENKGSDTEVLVSDTKKDHVTVGKLMSQLVNQSSGARAVVVIVVGNGHGDTSSNLGPDWLHFA